MADVQRPPNIPDQSWSSDAGIQTGTKKNTSTPQAQVPDVTTGAVEEGKKKVDDAQLEERIPEPEVDPELDTDDKVSKTKDKVDSIKDTAESTEKPELDGSAEIPAGEELKSATEPASDEVKDAAEHAETLTNGDFNAKSTDDLADKAADLKETADDPTNDVEKGEEVTGDLEDKVDIPTKDIELKDGDITGDLENVKEPSEVEAKGEEVTGDLQENVEKPTEEIEGKGEEAVGDLQEKTDEITPPTDEATSDLKKNVDDKVDETTPEDVNAEIPEDVEAPEVPIDLSILKDKKVNKLGKIVGEDGTPYGQLISGDPKKLFGKKVDAEGQIWDDSGKVIGRAELLPDADREVIPSAPFEDFPDSVVDKSGNVIFEGRIIGKLSEGDAKKLEGKKVDADGDILDKNGNILGKAERIEEEEPVPEEVVEEEKIDLSSLEGKKVNKAGNVVDHQGRLFGKVVTGDVSKLVGKKVDKDGKIWSESGKVIGTAELIPEDDRDEDSGAPFEDFPDAIVVKDGFVKFEDQIVGKLVEGDAKKLLGKKVDKDGEIVDKIGNVLGKAERWEEEEAPAPEAVDLSALAGKRVNKLGYLVDSTGSIYGRLVSGDPKKLVGKMADKNGDIWNDGGVIVGKAELVPDSDRAGEKDGPFASFDGPTVIKDGKVADSKGLVIGRLIEGDAKKLFGKPVDADGDILDSNGNTIGKAERWEEEEKEIKRHPAAGRRVNKQGDVVDENGDLIAKLTEGEITKCAGKEIDNDGDVVDGKGSSIGHVTLLEDIPAPPEPEPVVEEPQETEEEIAERKQLEQDKKLANQMAACITQSIDKIKPILKLITDTIDAAERQPKEELDEQKLVDTVRPLLEEGGGILQEANGVIRGLDPDGRIQGNAKGKSASREATPEEYRLAEVLKELTGSVTQTIEQAKKKIAGMPHAKKELNPLWGLLAEPLGQILAAVGLLLSGVLGLVGRLLSVLGLGGLLDNLLGGLGIKGILEGLGLGSLTKSLTGKK